MTHLSNDPKQFAETALRGYCDIHARIVLATPGGVLRATTTPEGKVAVVIGGGSGHYPAFAGYVGAGLADAAVVGDVFASPSRAESFGITTLEAWSLQRPVVVLQVAAVVRMVRSHRADPPQGRAHCCRRGCRHHQGRKRLGQE